MEMETRGSLHELRVRYRRCIRGFVTTCLIIGWIAKQRWYDGVLWFLSYSKYGVKGLKCLNGGSKVGENVGARKRT